MKNFEGLKILQIIFVKTVVCGGIFEICGRVKRCSTKNRIKYVKRISHSQFKMHGIFLCNKMKQKGSKEEE